MENIITVFGIILSSLGIIISFLSLIFAIIYLIKIHELQKLTNNLEGKITILDNVKEVFIAQCVLFPGDGPAIKGRECIDFIRQKYNCDEMTAIKIYYSGDKYKASTQKKS